MKKLVLPGVLNSWEEAIDATIKLHEYAEHTGITYEEIKRQSKPDSWHYQCPLCQYVFGEAILDGICSNCLWIRFIGFHCSYFHKHGYDYEYNNLESVKRLKEWKEKLKNT